MDVSRYFYNSKYTSAGLESNKYKAWWVSQMYGRLSLPAESSHPSDRGHLISALHFSNVRTVHFSNAR